MLDWVHLPSVVAMMSRELHDAAELYVLKYSVPVIPILGKRPMVQWKQYQKRLPTRGDIRSWSSRASGLALPTGSPSGRVVVDCDSLADGRWFWKYVSRSSAAVTTRRGVHLYFKAPSFRVRNAVHVQGRYDIRGEGGYVCIPPTPGYTWKVGSFLSDVPLFLEEWMPQKKEPKTRHGVKDAVEYIKHIQAVEGQQGSNATWRAIHVLKESGLDELDVFYAIHQWNNTNAFPPWDHSDLVRKVKDAFNRE